MNHAIELMLDHRSVRSFQDKEVTDDQLRWILKSAQAASTSSFHQAYSIIGVNDGNKKQKLAELAGNQKHVATNGRFLVFCLDLNRLWIAGNMEHTDMEKLAVSLESTEMFMVGVIDAALAAQNAALAAEAMGLGICYIGGLRNNLEQVSNLLKTPDRVIPLFGMAIGVPDNITGQKQRLPLEAVYHQEEYVQDEKTIAEQLSAYNEEISEYYKLRTNGARQDRWTEQVVSNLLAKQRLYIKDFLGNKNIPLR